MTNKHIKINKDTLRRLYDMYINRTDYCGNFSIKDEGKTITVAGWVQRRRVLGGLIFIDLRDRTGFLQLL